MTSVTLISPKGKGQNYTVKFRENIIIPKDSKVYLNYAHLTKYNGISFTKDQTIEFTDMVFQPSVQYDGVTPITLDSTSITIPANNPDNTQKIYTIIELEDEINLKLLTFIQNNAELYIYKPVERNNKTSTSSIIVGLCLDPNVGSDVNSDFIINTDMTLDMKDDEYDIILKESATSDYPHYDCYSLATEEFMHFSIPCSTSFNTDVNDMQQAVIKVKTNVKMNEQQGNISFGLYSNVIATKLGAFTGWANRTSGDANTTPAGGMINPGIFNETQLPPYTEPVDPAAPTPAELIVKKTYASAILGSYLTIEITGINNFKDDGTTPSELRSVLRICVPTFDADVNNTPKVWDSIDKNIYNMVELTRIKLNKIADSSLGIEEQFEVALQFYCKTADNNYLSNTDRKIYFRLYYNVDEDFSKQVPIYDSNADDFYYPQSFFTGIPYSAGDTAEITKAKVQSQIPFTLIVSAQIENEGFETIKFNEFSTNQGFGVSDIHPKCLLTQYKMRFSPDLERVLGINTTELLFANLCEDNKNFLFFQDIIASWLNKSYDVVLNGLPIKSYKNNENTGDGGFQKSVISTLPVPFLNANEDYELTEYNILMSGLYEPTFKNILKLNNQETILNSLTVEILDSMTELPANELHQTNISLTIIDDE
jgi:hypothetical protein